MDNTGLGTAMLVDGSRRLLRSIFVVAMTLLAAVALLIFGLFLGFMWRNWVEGPRWVDYSIITFFIVYLVYRVLKSTSLSPVQRITRFLQTRVSEEQVKTFLTFRTYGCDIGVSLDTWNVLGPFNADLDEAKQGVDDVYARQEALDRVWLRIIKNRPQDLVEFVQKMKPFTSVDLQYFRSHCPYKTAGMWS